MILAQATDSNTITLNPVADSWVGNRSSRDNYGDRRSLNVYNWNSLQGKSHVSNAYLMFFLTNTPPNITIESANLIIYVSSLDANIKGFVHYCPDSSWKEFEIKWKNAPNFNKDYVSSVKLSKEREFYSFNVTDIINQAIKKDLEKITFVITAEEMTNLRGFSFNSKENGLKEQILPTGEKQNGYHINPYDPQDIAWGIKQVLQDKKRAEWMGQNARERAIKMFSWEKVTQRTLNIYQDFIK